MVASEPDEWTADEQRVDLVAAAHGLPLLGERDLYAAAERGELGQVDLVVSFLFWNRIREPLISLGRLGCINLHPAPLPDLRGVGGYNVALLEGRDEWGVSCHFVDERIDTGDLVEVERFPIDAAGETALSLDVLSQERLLALFQRVMERALSGAELPREPQGEGRYVSRAELEELRVVRPGRRPGAQAARLLVPALAGRGGGDRGSPADAGGRRAARRAGARLPRVRRGAVASTRAPAGSTLRA